MLSQTVFSCSAIVYNVAHCLRMVRHHQIPIKRVDDRKYLIPRFSLLPVMIDLRKTERSIYNYNENHYVELTGAQGGHGFA